MHVAKVRIIFNTVSVNTCLIVGFNKQASKQYQKKSLYKFLSYSAKWPTAFYPLCPHSPPFLPIPHLPLRRHQQRDFFVFIPVEATVGNVDAAQRIEQGFERLAADG